MRERARLVPLRPCLRHDLGLLASKICMTRPELLCYAGWLAPPAPAIFSAEEAHGVQIKLETVSDDDRSLASSMIS